MRLTSHPSRFRYGQLWTVLVALAFLSPVWVGPLALIGGLVTSNATLAAANSEEENERSTERESSEAQGDEWFRLETAFARRNQPERNSVPTNCRFSIEVNRELPRRSFHGNLDLLQNGLGHRLTC